LSFATASAFAQTDRIYVGGSGGFAVSTATTSQRVTAGDIAFEAGARLTNNLVAFGDVGRISSLTPSISQPAVDATVNSLSDNDGVNVVGSSHMPARYALFGLKLQARGTKHVTPFILGGLGIAHLTPTSTFTFSSGFLPGTDPNAAAPAVGDDVTPQITTLGAFAPPPTSTAMMLSAGGGAELSVTPRWAVDAEYRLSRIAADTPLRAQGITFGLGYRF
jgi:opacity protein-like surface antigen